MDKSLNFPGNSQLLSLYLETGRGGGKKDISIRSVRKGGYTKSVHVRTRGRGSKSCSQTTYVLYG